MVLVAAREVRPDRNAGSRTIQISSRVCQRRLCHVCHVDLALTTAIRPAALVRSALCDPAGGHHSRHVLNSASLSLDRFLGSVRRERQHRSRLSLATAIATIARGARGQLGAACAHHQSNVGRRIVTLRHHDGTDSRGLDPLEAVKYQILLMFLLRAAAISALVRILSPAWSLTDDRQRFVWTRAAVV